MKDKINVAELLRNCPSGMELDCTMYENVYFDQIFEIENCLYSIGCYTIVDGIRTSINFTKFGEFNTHMNSKCLIFPKGKTTWEGFVPPGQFKDGDVVISSLGHIHILKNPSTSYIFVNFVHNSNGSLCKSLTTCVNVIRLATEEEKAKLFQAIKDNGYKWNEETKTLEKVVPKFQVGDKVKPKNHISKVDVVTGIKDTYYILNDESALSFTFQDEYELIPDKFDINTLVPFESRVLTRDSEREKWHPGIWGFYNSAHQNYPYKLIGDLTRYCIPYEGNEHLLGTANDCDEYFKTWK